MLPIMFISVDRFHRIPINLFTGLKGVTAQFLIIAKILIDYIFSLYFGSDLKKGHGRHFFSLFFCLPIYIFTSKPTVLTTVLGTLVSKRKVS